MTLVEWIYLSPHFDDVALSVGGWVWEQSAGGQGSSIWTICAGEMEPEGLSPFAQELHTRWGIESGTFDIRWQEDQRSCRRLGAKQGIFPVLDCIYRGAEKAFYPSEESLFGELNPGDSSLVEELTVELQRALPEEAELICPLALGNHVDHQLTRRAAEGLGRPLWYYADYPYVVKAGAKLERMKEAGWQPVQFPVSEVGLKAWVDAVACHASQISTFWESLDEMKQAIETYSRSQGGVQLWKAPQAL